ncbi:hypothetical protein BHE74_00043098 [Ensete ventricosum]|nr:hypothetical protein BHE74_00043098 [Ensete ventricosum]
MSQERPSTNPNLEHLGDQAHISLPTLQATGLSSFLLVEETSMPAPTPNRYWRLLNDPRCWHPNSRASLDRSPNRRASLDNLHNRRSPNRCQFEESNWRRRDRAFLRPRIRQKIQTPRQHNQQAAPRDIARVLPDPDAISSNSTDSIREQLRLVNQKLDEVQKDFAKSKEEVSENSKAGSPFVPEKQDEPVPLGF